MEKSKKQRKDQQLKQSLKTLLAIEPHLLSSYNNPSLLQKLYKDIPELNSLRIFAILEIIYLLEVYLDIIEKNQPSFLPDFKIGIIGCGITSRIILNSILALQKDGLSLRNITVSTRQTDNLKFYVQNFGINAVFDNQTTAKESDFLIISTPSTLDNWIILDLKESLNFRIKFSQKNSTKQNINPSFTSAKIVSEKSQKTQAKQAIQDRKSSPPKNTTMNSILIQKSQLSKRPFNPLVYILTSDFDQQKCKRLFPFPVLTPSIRIGNMKHIKQKLKQSDSQGVHLEKHQKVLVDWLSAKSDQKTGHQQSKQSAELQINPDNQSLQTYNRYLRSPFSRIINTFAFICNSHVSITSFNSSYSNTVSLSESLKDKKREQELIEVLDVLTDQGRFDHKMYKRLKKWQMAYNNYTS